MSHKCDKRKFSSFEQRIVWLVAHKELLIQENPDKHKIILAMKHDGLVSPKTYWPDVKLDEEIHQAKIRWYASHNQ